MPIFRMEQYREHNYSQCSPRNLDRRHNHGQFSTSDEDALHNYEQCSSNDEGASPNYEHCTAVDEGLPDNYVQYSSQDEGTPQNYNCSPCAEGTPRNNSRCSTSDMADQVEYIGDKSLVPAFLGAGPQDPEDFSAIRRPETGTGCNMELVAPAFPQESRTVFFITFLAPRLFFRQQ
jgi:hypothetical protein